MLNPRFSERVQQMEVLFDQLMACELVSATQATRMKDFPVTGGIYLFYENDIPLYVGRSDNMKRRVRIHRTSDHMGASFAYKLAREQARETRLDFGNAVTKREMMNVPAFKQLFIQAKQRISGMSVRYVVLEDSISQLLLEAYVHLRCNTPYNDFDNH